MMFALDLILPGKDAQLSGAIYGFAFALTLWSAYTTLSAVRRDRRRIELVDAGEGVALALAICSLIVASEPAAGIVIAVLVIYGMVVAALAWTVSHHDRLGRFQTAPGTGPAIRPAAHQPALSECHRRPQLARQTGSSRPLCERARSRRSAPRDRQTSAAR